MQFKEIYYSTFSRRKTYGKPYDIKWLDRSVAATADNIYLKTLGVMIFKRCCLDQPPVLTGLHFTRVKKAAAVQKVAIKLF